MGGNILIYFTSDLHLGNRGIHQVHQRPFRSLDEMNKVLIDNYNAIVKPSDTVYILGDLCNGVNLKIANAFIAQLNGKKILIRGNHDKNYDESLFVEVCDYKIINYHGKHFVLMHYPMMDWIYKNKGSIHLHGHLHAKRYYNLNNKRKGIKRFDVGVDENNNSPYSDN